MNNTATTYTAQHAFEALDAIKAAKAKYDAICSPACVGGFRYCPDSKISQAYHAAGRRLFEVADFFFAKLTGFKTLQDCLEAQGHGYRPTFREDYGNDLEVEFLAETYDYLAECRGLPLRAYRPERRPLPVGVPAIPECVRNHDGRRPAGAAADNLARLSREGKLIEAIKCATRLAGDKQHYPIECRDWFSKAADSLLNSLDADKPGVLTLQWIKDRLSDLRDIAHDQAKTLDVRFLRSSGHEVRLGGGDYYEYSGGWNGTLKDLKSHAERCQSKGGDTVNVGGQWLCADSLEDTFDPTDCEWNLSLTVDEILGIGKKRA